MGCPVLFPIGRELPQFYTLNFGPSGLESLPVSHRPHRQCCYRVIINRDANFKQCRHRGGCYDKCAVSALSRLVSRCVVPAYELHSAYPMLARIHSRYVVRNRLSAKVNSGFPIRAVLTSSPKTRLGNYQKQFDKTGRPKRPADLW
jgi:hypothetical protein